MTSRLELTTRGICSYFEKQKWKPCLSEGIYPPTWWWANVKMFSGWSLFALQTLDSPSQLLACWSTTAIGPPPDTQQWSWVGTEVVATEGHCFPLTGPLQLMHVLWFSGLLASFNLSTHNRASGNCVVTNTSTSPSLPLLDLYFLSSSHSCVSSNLCFKSLVQ